MQQSRPAATRYTARWSREPNTGLFVAQIIELDDVVTEAESIDELFVMVRDLIGMISGEEDYFVDWEPADS